MEFSTQKSCKHLHCAREEPVIGVGTIFLKSFLRSLQSKTTVLMDTIELEPLRRSTASRASD